MEVWTILDWTNPGRPGTSKQWKDYCEGIDYRPICQCDGRGASLGFGECKCSQQMVTITVRDKVLWRIWEKCQMKQRLARVSLVGRKGPEVDGEATIK
jgi:hypothetical protein